jgi:hypothetical protein
MGSPVTSIILIEKLEQFTVPLPLFARTWYTLLRSIATRGLSSRGLRAFGYTHP